MEKSHTDHVCIRILIIAHCDPRFSSYLLAFTKYLSINLLPVVSYYANNMKLCKKL